MKTVGEVCPSVSVTILGEIFASLLAFCQAVGEGLDGEGERVVYATSKGLAFQIAFVLYLAGPVSE
jgi:hypothetical protein